ILSLSSSVPCTFAYLHSLPTRRSSDLIVDLCQGNGDLGLASEWATSCQALIADDTQGIDIRAAGGHLSGGLLGCQVLGGAHHLRSEEHTSELQSRFDLVCRLLLEKKKM